MHLVRNVCLGIAGGLAGSAAMHVFRFVWESTVSRNTRHTIFGFDDEADSNAARLAWQLFSKDMPAEQQARRTGIAMHYAFGAVIGIAYRLTWPSARSDEAFGALLWLCADEIPISAFGISDPLSKSGASHISALTAHLIFAGVAGRVTRVLQFG